MGNVKGVIAPEDISMNCSEDAKPPKCPIPGHAWQSIVHKDEATWLAYYKDTINGEFKYIFLSAGSSLKGQSDRDKFEKARSLKTNVAGIRAKITRGLKSSDLKEAQQNTALWLIDNLAIRAGNEKDTSEEGGYSGLLLAPRRTHYPWARRGWRNNTLQIPGQGLDRVQTTPSRYGPRTMLER
jgi:DNA topoisomerase I